MKKRLTPCISDQHSKSKIEQVKENVLGPYEETLMLIRQFARVYQSEPQLEQGLCSYLMN